ncbi:hypothetical protein [Bacillus cereus]|uniref:hypothetical protein n=1 Tax=Bacillus cereus TaxID=1396 RepID=UPI0025B08239|nr:hypothetical protein [Bacillus cereus]WJX05715.1 hypothetical protein QTA68_02205 [Bacillus cereus]
MAKIEKNLFSFKYPEYKVTNCVTGWTWGVCGSGLNLHKCKVDIHGPCKQTKISQFRVYVLVTYPDDVEESVKKEINRCHNIAVTVATGVIIKAATASSVVGPQATIAAAIGAIGPAAKAYGSSFYGCLNTIPVSIRDKIKASIKHEDKGLTGWRNDLEQFTYINYDYFPVNNGYDYFSMNNRYNNFPIYY